MMGLIEPVPPFRWQIYEKKSKRANNQGKNIKRPPDWLHLPYSTIKADQKKSDRLCQRCLADLKQKKTLFWCLRT